MKEKKAAEDGTKKKKNYLYEMEATSQQVIFSVSDQY